MEISSISPRTVQAAVNDLVARYRPMTVRGYYGTFRAMLADAVEMDVIGRSPCRGIRLPPAKPAEKRVITPAELHRLADAVGEQWRSMIYLAGFLGLRFGEIGALRLMDVDLDAGRLTVSRTLVEVNGRLEFGDPKTQASVRTLDLPAALLEELRSHVRLVGISQGEELLFADRFGGPLRRSNFRRRVFDPATSATGVPGLTFHGLRHSAATVWMASGVDARTVQHLLGHSDPRLVLRLYAHVANDAVRRGVQQAAHQYWQQ